jgi:hypothetical protein
MRGAALAVISALVLAACEPPPEANRVVGAAEVDPPPRREPLPPPVEATVDRLNALAEEGDYRKLAAFANETEGFRSNTGGMTHSEYWYLKMRTGDVPMQQVKKLLSLNHVVRESSQGRIFIWPALALVEADAITPAQAREIDALLGPGQAETIRNGGVWPGYVLGIREDGKWLYFVSGTG